MSNMDIDFTTLGAYERYKLMASLIVPRPIALVTTLNAGGVVNAAPFSMFNMVSEDPPLVMLSVNVLEGGALKHTAANIIANGEFVVHLIDEPLTERMHVCGEAMPEDVSEVAVVGFTTAPSLTVRPPCIVEAPVAFECVLHEHLKNPSRDIFFGRVQSLRAREGLVDTERWRVSLQHYFPIGRFGASFYVNTRERFPASGNGVGERVTPIDEI